MTETELELNQLVWDKRADQSGKITAIYHLKPSSGPITLYEILFADSSKETRRREELLTPQEHRALHPDKYPEKVGFPRRSKGTNHVSTKHRLLSDT